MAPALRMLCLLVPEFLSGDQLSITCVKGLEGKILGSCPSKAVFLHQLTLFLAPWQVPGEQEKVKVR